MTTPTIVNLINTTYLLRIMMFSHKVSKGSRFNQIYIPKEVENDFEVGDLVEVRLIKKKDKSYYSKNLPKLSEFKEGIIKKIFSILEPFKEIKQVFIIGSFLTQKIDFNDIDLILITNNKNLDEAIYNKLTDTINLKFHIISIPEDNLSTLQEICPLTKSMFYYYVSNKDFNLSKKTRIDKNHIKFLLMLPEDLLEVETESRGFYDSIRRLITIKRFLLYQDINPVKIYNELETMLGPVVSSMLRNNGTINEEIIKKLREIIKREMDIIYKLIKNE